MSAPTAPTLVTLTVEALKKAGYPNPTSNNALLTRAQDEWMEEIKNDIWDTAKKLVSLQTTSVLVTTQNLARYSYPTDFSSDLTMKAIHGNVTGTAQTGTASTITLSASETVAGSSILSRNILIYEGTALGSMSQCITYNSTTKVATVSPDFETAPDGTSKYMIIDRYYPIKPGTLWDLDSESNVTSRGIPTQFMKIGDGDDKELILFKTPYHVSGVPYGLELRYYADLMELDLSGTLMATLYKKWRNVFIAGVYAKSLQARDDTEEPSAKTEYILRLRNLISRETYGVDLSSLQMTVSDC